MVSLAYQTDDAAIWRLNSHRIGEVEGNRRKHTFYSSMNQNAKVIENTFANGSFKNLALLYSAYDPDLFQIVITFFLGQAIPT